MVLEVGARRGNGVDCKHVEMDRHGVRSVGLRLGT